MGKWLCPMGKGCAGAVLTVIVMTFWYVFGTDLIFLNFFELYSSLGIDHDPYVHMFILFSYVSFFTRVYGQEKS